MKMTAAKRKHKGGKSKGKKSKKMSAKNKEMLKKEGKKASMNGDVEIMEITETQNTGKNNEKKQNEKENVATETSRNKTHMKNKNEKQGEEKMEQENKDNTEEVAEQAESKSGRKKIIGVKKKQENANQGKNADAGKRKRAPEDDEKVVSVPKKKQKVNITEKDKCTLFIRFPESLVVKKQSHVKTIVGIDVVNVRFPNVPRGTSKGFCYVEFESEKEAKIIKKKLEKKQVDGESFHVEYLAGKLKVEGAQTSKNVDLLSLYVGRLPKRVKEEKLRAVFPTAVKIKHQNGKSKLKYSHAYVNFKTAKEAQKVLEASKGLKVGDSEILVMFANLGNKKNKATKEKKNDNELPTPPAKKTKV